MTDSTPYKRAAAVAAVAFVQPGMVLGLGSGSTAAFAIQCVGEQLRAGRLRDVVGVPTSRRSAALARRCGVPVTTLDEHPLVDLTIDGTDEVDPALNLIKGGGGALLREKIVAQASRREIIIADESKATARLGTRCPVPVEIIPFARRPLQQYLESLGAAVGLRPGARDHPFRTDEGNWILDCAFGPITDPAALALQLQARAGIVEHGLFLHLASELILAGPQGVRHVGRDG
jgi:ribose 5-phosphate isomerase A